MFTDDENWAIIAPSVHENPQKDQPREKEAKVQQVAISEAKTSDLVAFYNVHAVRLQDGKPVSKFADRKTAEKRVSSLVEKLASYFQDKEGEVYPDEGMIFVGELTTDEGEPVEIKPVEQTSNVKTMEIDGDDQPEDEEDDQPEVNSFGAMGAAIGAMSNKSKEDTVPRSTIGRASNSLGVAISWTVPTVRAERLTRHGVSVTDEDGESLGEFKSTLAAFHELHLPVSKHIRFRLKLKAAGAETFEFGGKSYRFELLE